MGEPVKGVRFNASSKDGAKHKAYIARIIGRDPSFTFSREFVGRKYSRGDCEFLCDEPGLYMECDADKNGRTNTYYIVYQLPGVGLKKYRVEEEQAMELARKLDAGAVNYTLEALKIRLEINRTRDQDQNVHDVIGQFGLTENSVTRRELGNLIEAEIDRIEGKVTPALSKSEAVNEVIALMDELGVTLDDLKRREQ